MFSTHVGSLKKNPPLRFPAVKCNPLPWTSSSFSSSYQPLQGEGLSIRQPQRVKTSPSPRLSYQRAPSSHRTVLGQQLTPLQALQRSVRTCERTTKSINSIFIHSPLAASHSHVGLEGVDCAACTLAVITIIFAGVALHMTGRHRAPVLVIPSLMSELPQRDLRP